MNKIAIVLCLDGCSPDYLESSNTSYIQHIKKTGYYSVGHSMIPSVTNVNAVSIITGKYPAEHGIIANYYFNRETSREIYMESPHFINVPTIFHYCKKQGYTTALATSKEKLRKLLNHACHHSFSAEHPPTWLKKRIGVPPSIYSLNIDIWLMKAFRELIMTNEYNLVYVMTTDYTMHKYAPGDAESNYHLTEIDAVLQETIEILEAQGKEVLLCITADHGMSEKTRAVNLESILRAHNISSKMNPLIRDRYVVHHHNLGGAAYLYLNDEDNLSACLQILEDTEGVMTALPRDEAAQRYHLDESRIGDVLVLGKRNYVFGFVPHDVYPVSLRSHGSLHERAIPLMVNLQKSELSLPLYENKDLASLTLQWLSNDR